MFEAQHARNLVATLREMLAELQEITDQEAELHQQINPEGKPTPISAEAIVLLSTKRQLLTLTNAVATIGSTLAEILTDRAEEQELGL